MSGQNLNVLVVDDERAIRRFLRASLSTHGYTVLEAENGSEALAITAERQPDVIFLDLGLPDMDGIEVTRRLREWTEIPIIILSVRDQEMDKIQALDAGADDYLTKPFGMGELMARVRGVLRRTLQTTTGDAIVMVSDLQVDLANRQVSKNGAQISLTPTEYDILKVLVQHAGKVMTHQQIILKVWGSGYAEEAHLLRVNISNLRRKIESNPTRPELVITEPGVGYRLRV
jgi:two-component system, OmpR family, KDP operon response regulator KdpE